MSSRNEKKLLDQVREVMRLKHYSIHTERSYCDWIDLMGTATNGTSLAICRVSASVLNFLHFMPRFRHQLIVLRPPF